MIKTLPTQLLPFCWHFIKKYPFSFALFFISPACLILEGTVQPYALKIFVDAVISHTGDKNNLPANVFRGAELYLFSWILLSAIARVQNWRQCYVLPCFLADIRLSVLDYLSQHSYHYFSNQLSGNLANKIADLPRAIDTIRMIFCWRVIGPCSVALASILLIMTISPLSAAILTLWMISHILITLTLSKRVDQLSFNNAEDGSQLIGAIVDMISNIISVKLFSRGQDELQYIGAVQKQEIKSRKIFYTTTNVLRFYMDVLICFAIAGILYALVVGWQKGFMSPGGIAFILFSSTALIGKMWGLGDDLVNLFREVGVAKQALALVSAPIAIKDHPQAKILEVTRGEIVFDHVTFNYHHDKKLFSNKNVIITPGSKVGLVGYSGSGKTTFINLILRFFDIIEGEIRIDGQNISKVTQDSLHENIAVVPQDTSLFHRTLFDNIRYGKLTATEEEVISASKRAHCHEFISQLPEGYQTLVGERGIKLSGGQRQRIAIARAILKNSPILILDEATSALDSVTEKYIQSGFQDLMRARTTIVIAHRLSTLSHMDRILVFDAGKIIEDGTHDALLAQNGHYAKMWKMQAGGFLPDTEA